MRARERAAEDRHDAPLAERRAQIDAKQKLPNLPGQAVYLARIKVISTYKDLTDALPSRIGRGNKFGVPPAYFEAAIEPHTSYSNALVAGVSVLRRLFGTEGPGRAQDTRTPDEPARTRSL